MIFAFHVVTIVCPDILGIEDSIIGQGINDFSLSIASANILSPLVSAIIASSSLRVSASFCAKFTSLVSSVLHLASSAKFQFTISLLICFFNGMSFSNSAALADVNALWAALAFSQRGSKKALIFFSSALIVLNISPACI
ncbi:MAG: hypothetical protein DDT23_00873 [candidate division WS2 bacterium]|nr:hypothetical protein [Candidatus Lithacetigena glycinireducens]